MKLLVKAALVAGALAVTTSAGFFVGRAQAVPPVVRVGEAAARPAQQGRLHRLHRVDEGLPNTIGVGDLGLRADPHAVVDNSTKVLDEVTIDLRRNGTDWLSGQYIDVRIDRGRALREEVGSA